MIEKTYRFTQTDSKTIERIVSDENVDINHMVLGTGESLPEHSTNSHVHMIVVRGTVALRLDAQESHEYPAGSIIAIPFRTRMNASNAGDTVCELFVVKAPSPSKMS